MDFGMDAKFWLDILQWITTVGVAIYVWANGRHKATREQIEKQDAANQAALQKIDERVVGLKLRVTQMDSDLKHIPTSQAFNNLALQFESLHGDFKRIGAELQGVRELQGVMRNQTQMMDEFLRARK